MSYFSHSGANVPRHFRSRQRMFQGAKVPYMVLSLLGAKVRGNESSSPMTSLCETTRCKNDS